jgi:hypothetical protein
VQKISFRKLAYGTLSAAVKKPSAASCLLCAFAKGGMLQKKVRLNATFV